MNFGRGVAETRLRRVLARALTSAAATLRARSALFAEARAVASEAMDALECGLAAILDNRATSARSASTADAASVARFSAAVARAVAERSASAFPVPGAAGLASWARTAGVASASSGRKATRIVVRVMYLRGRAGASRPRQSPRIANLDRSAPRPARGPTSHKC